MRHSQWPEIVIAGTGVSACALAILLRKRAFRVILLHRKGPSTPPGVIESIPLHAVRLFREIGLHHALAEAGGVAVNGFVNAWQPERLVHVPGWHVHVDRAALAQSALAEAVGAGAVVAPINSATPPRQAGPKGTQVWIDGQWRQVFAGVDATGRSAAWSRPIARDVCATATLYVGPGRESAQPGQVVRLSSGWAYRLSHPKSTTVGLVLGRGAGPGTLDSQLGKAVGVRDPERFDRIGHRTASIQWSQNPVQLGLLAIGDAALSYNPIAGNGIRFGLASALAAANVLTTWRDGNAEVASEYYRRFVAAARKRHIEFVHKVLVGHSTSTSKPSTDLPANRLVRFSAGRCLSGINRSQSVVPDIAFILRDGGLVRWVGTLDLMILFRLTCIARPIYAVRLGLMAHGLTLENANTVLQWSIERGVLSWDG
jgi:hypothetical protein